MEWTGYLLSFMAGFAVLGIFALQVLHAVAEYHERAVAFNAVPNKRLIDPVPCQAVDLRIHCAQ